VSEQEMPGLDTIADTFGGVVQALLDAHKRIEARGPEAVEQAARKSALWTIERNPGCGIDRVCAQQGLDHEHASKAIRQLKAMGQIRERRSGGYEVAAGKS